MFCKNALCANETSCNTFFSCGGKEFLKNILVNNCSFKTTNKFEKRCFFSNNTHRRIEYSYLDSYLIASSYLAG